MSQPGTTHTLQLLGLSTRARAEAFQRERAITGRSEILESRLNGKPLFLVVYGSYPSRAAAQAALNKLPDSLSDTRPWARSVSSLRPVVR
jgi:DamX protein